MGRVVKSDNGQETILVVSRPWEDLCDQLKLGDVCVYVYMCVLGVRVAGAFMVLDDRNDLFLVAHSDQSKD